MIQPWKFNQVYWILGLRQQRRDTIYISSPPWFARITYMDYPPKTQTCI